MSARFGDRYVRIAVKTPSQNQRVAAAIVDCDVVYAT
jgi:histidinol-phosphate/aromatic aminotransferase/cobyric acid decarboxylase-like protein